MATLAGTPTRAAQPYAPGTRDIETIDSERRLVATLRRAARERGGPMPWIDVAEALLDERRELGDLATCHGSAHGDLSSP